MTIVYVSFDALGGKSDQPLHQALPALSWLRDHYQGDFHFRVDSRHNQVCFDFPATIPIPTLLLFKLTWGGG